MGKGNKLKKNEKDEEFFIRVTDGSFLGQEFVQKMDQGRKQSLRQIHLWLQGQSWKLVKIQGVFLCQNGQGASDPKGQCAVSISPSKNDEEV